MTIPEDVRSAASRCIMKAAGNPRLDDVAEAIWEERKRCARVAREWNRPPVKAEWIARAIMEPA